MEEIRAEMYPLFYFLNKRGLIHAVVMNFVQNGWSILPTISNTNKKVE